MKAITVQMNDLVIMTKEEATEKKLPMITLDENDNSYIGYCVNGNTWVTNTYANKYYFLLADPDGHSIFPSDVLEMETKVESTRIGVKNTNTCITLKTGFEVHGQSGCVDPKQFDLEIGEKFARPKAEDHIWFGLGFVLQWAINGLSGNK